MRLTKEAIEEFKSLYLKDYGKALTDEEADTMGWELLELMDLLLRPTPPRS